MASPADHMIGSLLTCIYLSKPWQTAEQTKQAICRQLLQPIGSSCRVMSQGDRYITHVWHCSVLQSCKAATV